MGPINVDQPRFRVKGKKRDWPQLFHIIVRKKRLGEISIALSKYLKHKKNLSRGLIFSNEKHFS